MYFENNCNKNRNLIPLKMVKPHLPDFEGTVVNSVRILLCLVRRHEFDVELATFARCRVIGFKHNMCVGTSNITYDEYYYLCSIIVNSAYFLRRSGLTAT